MPIPWESCSLSHTVGKVCGYICEEDEIKLSQGTGTLIVKEFGTDNMKFVKVYICLCNYRRYFC